MQCGLFEQQCTNAANSAKKHCEELREHMRGVHGQSKMAQSKPLILAQFKLSVTLVRRCDIEGLAFLPLVEP
jgi:hypothetical protein